MRRLGWGRLLHRFVCRPIDSSAMHLCYCRCHCVGLGVLGRGVHHYHPKSVSYHPSIHQRVHIYHPVTHTTTKTLGIWARADQCCNGLALMAIGETEFLSRSFGCRRAYPIQSLGPSVHGPETSILANTPTQTHAHVDRIQESSIPVPLI